MGGTILLSLPFLGVTCLGGGVARDGGHKTECALVGRQDKGVIALGLNPSESAFTSIGPAGCPRRCQVAFSLLPLRAAVHLPLTLLGSSRVGEASGTSAGWHQRPGQGDHPQALTAARRKDRRQPGSAWDN